ncbi:hypothetical protein [Paracoccus sp. JM45]|uniref:hypothetical protein n=1 Tax=Paracoccus sp. JM45 TaxID=2283626 RepID=UPI000E6BD15C|nr:hypothetical protein DWB67_16035 [Paracoccus sp. JM45]
MAARHALPEDREQIARDFQAVVDACSDDEARIKANLAFNTSTYLATRNEFFCPIGHMLLISLPKMFRIASRG